MVKINVKEDIRSFLMVYNTPHEGHEDQARASVFCGTEELASGGMTKKKPTKNKTDDPAESPPKRPRTGSAVGSLSGP